MNDEDVWFEPKRFGYGSGLPIRWQGWALVAGYVAVVAVLALVLGDRHPALLATVVVLLTVALLPISARHTRGGWRWRWGAAA